MAIFNTDLPLAIRIKGKPCDYDNRLHDDIDYNLRMRWTYDGEYSSTIKFCIQLNDLQKYKIGLMCILN